MLTGRIPFHSYQMTKNCFSDANAILEQIVSGQEFSLANLAVSDQAKSVIRGLLTIDSKSRISIEDLEQHPWVRSGPSYVNQHTATNSYYTQQPMDNSSHMPYYSIVETSSTKMTLHLLRSNHQSEHTSQSGKGLSEDSGAHCSISSTSSSFENMQTSRLQQSWGKPRTQQLDTKGKSKQPMDWLTSQQDSSMSSRPHSKSSTSSNASSACDSGIQSLTSQQYSSIERTHSTAQFAPYYPISLNSGESVQDIPQPTVEHQPSSSTALLHHATIVAPSPMSSLVDFPVCDNQFNDNAIYLNQKISSFSATNYLRKTESPVVTPSGDNTLRSLLLSQSPIHHNTRNNSKKRSAVIVAVPDSERIPNLCSHTNKRQRRIIVWSKLEYVSPLLQSEIFALISSHCYPNLLTFVL